MESCAEGKQQPEMIRKGPWTPQEDEKLFAYVSLNGEGRWNLVPKATGLNRNGKSCRLRWVNYLRPDLKRSRISPDEELQIMELHRLWGNRWSRIAQNLPGRTDNEIKNYWRTLVKHKKLEREENKHDQGLWMNDRRRSVDAHDPCHKQYSPCSSSSLSSSSFSRFCTSSSSSQNEKLLCFDLSLRISAGTTEDFITRDRETPLFVEKIRNRSETNPHDV